MATITAGLRPERHGFGAHWKSCRARAPGGAPIGRAPHMQRSLNDRPDPASQHVQRWAPSSTLRIMRPWQIAQQWAVNRQVPVDGHSNGEYRLGSNCGPQSQGPSRITSVAFFAFLVEGLFCIAISTSVSCTSLHSSTRPTAVVRDTQVFAGSGGMLGGDFQERIAFGLPPEDVVTIFWTRIDAQVSYETKRAHPFNHHPITEAS